MRFENIYSDDYAMKYEYVMRKAHKCDRHGVAGADADTYRRLLRTANIYHTELKAIKDNTERRWRFTPFGVVCLAVEVRHSLQTMSR